jgi:serine protease SohB
MLAGLSKFKLSDELPRQRPRLPAGPRLHVSYQRKLTLPERVRVLAQSAWVGIWQPPGPLG